MLQLRGKIGQLLFQPGNAVFKLLQLRSPAPLLAPSRILHATGQRARGTVKCEAAFGFALRLAFPPLFELRVGAIEDRQMGLVWSDLPYLRGKRIDQVAVALFGDLSLSAMMKDAGFVETAAVPLTFGSATIFSGRKA